MFIPLKYILGAVAGILLSALLLHTCAEIRDTARRASCRPHVLFQNSEAFAKEHEGLFPPLSAVAGVLIYDVAVCEECKNYSQDHICEFDRQREDRAFHEIMYDHQFNDWSYVYLGYFIEDEAQLLAFADAYREAIASGRDFTGDLPVGKGKGTGGGDSLRRMQSLETLLASDAPPVKRPSEIPVVIEWPENHRHPGGHVVYLDGHTEFVDYPGKFPMTPAVIAALRDLDNYAPRVRYESYQD